MTAESETPLNILVLNCGSTTVKFKLIDARSRKVAVEGGVDRVGRPDCVGKSRVLSEGNERRETALPSASFADAMGWVFSRLPAELPLAAVGHRVVHGGSYFSEAAPIDEDSLRKIEECIPLAPLHNPVELAGIRESVRIHGEIPQFASFDTAFHQSKSALNASFALPRELAEKFGYRKFGFHGASHKYVAGRAAALLGRELPSLKLVTCHLGGGSSVAAVQGGVAVDTTATYGTFTGMPMGTRSGDIDAGVLLDMLMRRNMSAEEIYELIYKRSGLLALSGVSADMAELETLEAQGHEGARFARDYYAYALKRFVASLAAVMNGIDGLVFTAGIGEHDVGIRERVCRDLEWLGVRLDFDRNRERGGERIVSTQDSAVAVMVIPTDEELAIALEVAELLDRKRGA